MLPFLSTALLMRIPNLKGQTLLLIEKLVSRYRYRQKHEPFKKKKKNVSLQRHKASIEAVAS